VNTSGSSKWLSEMKRKSEVLKLRRKALEIARAIIEQDPRSEGMSATELEFAACDLCDRQVNEIRFQKDNDKGETSSWQ
jgi:hypothetical protein